MTPPKILILNGSPRTRGTTARLTASLSAAAEAAGSQVETVYLHGLDIRPCDACDLCHEQGQGCVIEDDMQTLYPKLVDANVIVVASPVYWFTLSAQTKLCIDRWYALETSQGNLLKGKVFSLLLAYGDYDPYNSGAVNAIHGFQDIVRYLQGDLVGLVYGTSLPDEATSEHPLLIQSRQLGEKLARL